MEIRKEIFQKEISICRKQYLKKGGCNWGKCEDCGVLPLLVKLYEGRLVEDKEEIKNLKSDLLKK